IGQKGGVKAPIHSDYLFSGLINLKSLSGKFITTETKTMAFMFASAGESAAEFELDLSGWDTSNVTDMYGMFYDAGESATTWSIGDLSGWDISKLEHSACDIFNGLSSTALTSLLTARTQWGCS
ncbi:MAG: BspA family leucine-rich repeat surface protein, partial [Mollicutes bacterium]|nr:BspA family leucine-rich repeat surface protein [Mollicutes bacterium]